MSGLYVLTYFNAFSLTHCVCTCWWITYFHSQLSLWNGWSVLRYLFINTFFPPLASGLLLKCPLLVLFFRCLVCHSRILCVPLFDYRWHKDILVTLVSWIGVGMISFFHGPLPLLWSWVLRWYIYRVSQEECARFREGVPYVKVYRYNPKHLCPKLKLRK